MFHVVAANEDEAAPSVDGGGIDDRQTRLAAAGRGIAQSITTEPAQPPEEGGQQADDHDKAEHQLDGVLTLAE
jgi:hypothetical protein